jgi:hypothetical protein
MVRPMAFTAIASLLISLGACDPPGLTEQQKETKASDEATNARNQAEQQSQNAQAAADKDIASARADFEKTRENYLHDKRLDLVTLDTKIMDLEAKARTLSVKARSDLDARLSAVLAQRDAFVRNMGALETEVGATWDSSKANLDKEWNSLKAALDDAAR